MPANANNINTVSEIANSTAATARRESDVLLIQAFVEQRRRDATRDSFDKFIFTQFADLSSDQSRKLSRNITERGLKLSGVNGVEVFAAAGLGHGFHQ